MRGTGRKGKDPPRQIGGRREVSILSDFEDRVGSAVERVFAGAFRSRVQPAEIAKALGRAMDDERMVGIGKVYAPVAYTVALSPQDSDKLRGFIPVLAGELATFLTQRAIEKGYHLAAKPSVIFVEHDDLSLGRFRVTAEHDYVEGADGAAPEARVDNRIEFFDAEVGGSVGRLDTVTMGETGHDVVLRGDRMLIGRLSTCDICLADANSSRRHAELLRMDDDWYVADLDSTNGTTLNGEPVTKARLRDGDVIEVGITRLTYHRGEG